MQQSFLANLQQQVSGRTFTTSAGNTVPVSLNVNDSLASIITVTFGSNGTSNSSMVDNSIFISASDMASNNNTATHEWLHTAGLMDRYIEVYGYSMQNGSPVLNSQRSAVIPMANLPAGYDSEYESSTNMMSVGKNQITQQQWGIVFSGVNERSGGGLGVVSSLLRNGIGSSSPTQTQIGSLTTQLNKMSFSGSQAFVLRGSGASALQVPFSEAMGVDVNKTRWMIHSTRGPNIYPPFGDNGTFGLYNSFNHNGTPNKGILDAFRR